MKNGNVLTQVTSPMMQYKRQRILNELRSGRTIFPSPCSGASVGVGQKRSGTRAPLTGCQLTGKQPADFTAFFAFWS
jgi:hypothetical protein